MTCSPSSFSTSWPTTSRPSNPAWDLEVESAETNEQTDTQTNTVVESGDEPHPADGQDDSAVVQQNETPEQTDVSQQIEPVQQQVEQVSNVDQNVASVGEEQPQNAQPVAVVAETQNDDQVKVELSNRLRLRSKLFSQNDLPYIRKEMFVNFTSQISYSNMSL